MTVQTTFSQIRLGKSYFPTSPPKNKLITGNELFRLAELGYGELIKGVFTHMPPPGYKHSVIENNIGRIIGNYVQQHKLGFTLSGEGGVYTHRNPDTVRGMDVAFISHARMAQVLSNTYLDVAPELIVEVLSPDDRWSKVNQKLEEYFSIGVQIVWVVDPAQRQGYVYHSLTDVQRFTTNDELTGGVALPGFSVPVAELFG